MLIIQRRAGERIVISNGVEITVAAVAGRNVRLAVNAPRGIIVLRAEVYDAFVAANAEAAGTSVEAAQESPILVGRGTVSCSSTELGSDTSKSTTHG